MRLILRDNQGAMMIMFDKIDDGSSRSCSSAPQTDRFWQRSVPAHYVLMRQNCMGRQTLLGNQSWLTLSVPTPNSVSELLVKSEPICVGDITKNFAVCSHHICIYLSYSHIGWLMLVLSPSYTLW